MSFTQKCVFFSVSAPDSICLIFTKFIDIGGLHAGKRVKMR